MCGLVVRGEPQQAGRHAGSSEAAQRPRPRTSNMMRPMGWPDTSSYTVRSAASMTPPVVPNSTPPPLPVPSGLSYSPSGSSCGGWGMGLASGWQGRG
jgi:hypothetical protein